jgi:tetratricopeptide (TPR) repeat protein
MSTPPSLRDHAFVSYSHKDAAWLDLLKKELAPDIRNGRIDYFDDREIEPGEHWDARIAGAIARARVAVLLVSPNFLASRYIMERELPPLFEAAAGNQLTILWTPIAGTFFGPVAAYQAHGSPTTPLETLDVAARGQILRDLCHDIERRLGHRRIPQNLPFGALADVFIGRDYELKAIAQSLARHGSAAITQTASHAVTGLGGIGKTRLAVEYARRNREKFTGLLFARANTASELRDSLAALCRDDGILDLREFASGAVAEQYAAVVRWLQHNPGWLLILDNVDTPEGASAVRALVGQLEGGQIIVTSRLATWDESIRQNLDVMTPEEARLLLLRHSGSMDSSGADAVVAKLGFLPLALEQAAAYVKRQGPGFAGYLRLYEANERRMLESGLPESAEYPRPVFLTWRTTIDRLPEGARRILRLHAWLAPTPFPIDLYVKGASLIFPGATELDIRDWIGSLIEYSLAARHPDDTISVHALVQAVQRHEEHEASAASEIHPTPETSSSPYTTIRALVGTTAPTPSWEPASRTLWDILIPHAEFLRRSAVANLALSSDTAILWKVASAYSQRGDYRAAIPPHRECLAIETQVFGAEHPNTLASANNLAFLLERKGEYAEAEALYRRAMEASERVLGAEHPNTLTSVNNLAGLLMRKGEYAGAELLWRRALEARERVLGAEHPSTLMSANNLALLLESKGEYAGAERLYRHALEACDRVLGDAEHPDTLTLVNNLAGLLERKGEYAEAEPLWRRALKARERVLGAEHPDTLTLVNNLAGLLERKGEYAEAESLYRRALEVRERVLGAEHPDTLTLVNNLAFLLKSKGEYAEAERLWRRALEVRERVLGADHPNTLTSVNNLALSLAIKGEYAEAEPLYRRALRAWERVLGAEHPNTLTSVNDLALLLMNKGQYAEAEPLHRRALGAWERVLGAEHPNTLTSVNNLAGLLASKGEYAEAERLWRRALEVRERVLGAEHPDTLTLVNNLAVLLKKKGEYADAEPLYRRALEATERVLGAEHPDTLGSVNNLAMLLESKGDYADAEPLYRRALEGLEKSLGPSHPNTKTIRENHARCVAALNSR